MYQGSRRFSNSGFSRSNQSFRPRYGRGSAPKKNRGETIDINRFVNKANPIVSEEAKSEHSFSDFGFCQKLNLNLNARNYTQPTPIQDKSIKHIMNGKDLIGLANTGTGKTAAFLLPLIHKCSINRNQKVLIIAPTRELAQQIDDEFRKFAQGMNLYSAICVGGMPIYKQIYAIKRNPNFIIGTPGRLKDLKDRGEIDFARFQNIVLDEIDRMLDMGFVVEIKRILSELPTDRQSLFFSATMPSKIRELVQQFLNQPVTIQVSSGCPSANVDQDVVKTQEHEKLGKLKDLLIAGELKKVLIFSETKRQVEKLTEELVRDGFKADSIHGDKRQTQRQRALQKFKESELQILVATDVAARGLDINNVTHVINYTVPQTYDDYIHRIGRTGRGDKKGFALTFVPGY